MDNKIIYQRKLKNLLNKWLLEHTQFISKEEKEIVINAADIVERWI